MSPGYGHNERDDCGHPCDFSSAATASGNAFDALTQSLVTFNEATADSAETIAELQERRSDLMKESKKGGLSERQIQKTMRFRGKR